MRCPYCNSEDTFSYFSASMLNIGAACPQHMLEGVRSYPLKVSLCQQCLLGFNSTPLTTQQLQNIYDHYLYISPLRGVGATKYAGMLEMLKCTFGKEDVIVDIGCSEGYLLLSLKEFGYANVMGVEPGPQAASVEALGIKVIKRYFDNEMFAPKSIDGFCLMHVFEHFENPFQVLRSMACALRPEGTIVIEVPNFDCFDHQHLFYYNINFLKRLCEDNDLKIITAAQEYTTQGVLRVVVAHKDSVRVPQCIPVVSSEEIVAEAMRKQGAFDEKIAQVDRVLCKYKKRMIFWWGAGSMALIFLNQVRTALLRAVELVVVDGDQSKWGCYMPGLNLRVQPATILTDRTVECLIVASSFHEEISRSLASLNVTVTHDKLFLDAC